MKPNYFPLIKKYPEKLPPIDKDFGVIKALDLIPSHVCDVLVMTEAAF